MKIDFEKLSEEIRKKYLFEIEGLTEKQAVQAFISALKAGDFRRFVTADNLAQTVVYIPGIGNDELQAENGRLRNILEEHGISYWKYEGESHD